jgi:hypothetical protein
MEPVSRTLMIQTLKVRLARCGDETSALAKEVRSSTALGQREVEALVYRAELEAKIIFLKRALQRLQLVDHHEPSDSQTGTERDGSSCTA